MTRVAIEAADRLAELGISCEVIDLRSLAPLDIATIAKSAARMGALRNDGCLADSSGQ